MTGEYEFFDRHWYDFFDRNGIMCYLEFDVDLQLWQYWIIEKHEDGNWSGGGAGGWKPEERRIAEEFMFKEAANILNRNS